MSRKQPHVPETRDERANRDRRRHPDRVEDEATVREQRNELPPDR